MKTSAVLTALALGALTAQVGATPARRKDVNQAKADVAAVHHDKPHAAKFCTKYLHGKKTTSPIKGVPVKRLSKACSTITSHHDAVLKSKSAKAAAASSAAAAAGNSGSDSQSANPLTNSASTIDPTATAATTPAVSQGSAAPRNTASSGSSASSTSVVTSAPGKTVSSMASGATSGTDSIRSMTSGEATPTDSGVPVITNISQVANSTMSQATSSASFSSSSILSSSTTSSSAQPTRTTVCEPCDKNTTLIGYGLSVRNDANNAGGYLLVPQGVDSTFALVAGAPSQGYSPLPFTANDDDELTAGNYVMAMSADGTLEMVPANSTNTALVWDLDYTTCDASFTVTNGANSYDALFLQLSNGKYSVHLGNEPTMANATQPAYIDLAPICGLSNVTAPANATAPSRRRM